MVSEGQNGSASRAGAWVAIALVIGLAATAGSLLLSMAMGLKACPLCFYQRTFVMAVVGVLGIGFLVRPSEPRLLALLALPAAVGGLGVAALHVYLELSGKLECPVGLFEVGSAPQQSLAAFVLLVGSLGAALASGSGAASPSRKLGGGAVVGAVALGLLFTVGLIKSVPPAPDGPPEICRPPYVVPD